MDSLKAVGVVLWSLVGLTVVGGGAMFALHPEALSRSKQTATAATPISNPTNDKKVVTVDDVTAVRKAQVPLGNNNLPQPLGSATDNRRSNVIEQTEAAFASGFADSFDRSYVANFVQSCSTNAPQALCRCIATGATQRISRGELISLSANISAFLSDSRIKQVVGECQKAQ